MATSAKVKSEQAKGERELASVLGETEAEALFENRRKRDGDKSHITLAGPPDAKKAVANLAARDGISKGEAERQIKTLAAKGVPDTFRVKGIGKAESGGKVAYFLVVDWPGGREFRETIGLDPGGQDFHITLGFGPGGDVHGVPKNRLMRASKLPMKQASLRSKLLRLANARPDLRRALLPILKQAATGDVVFDVKQELRGGHELEQDGGAFYYEYGNLVAEAVKDVMRRLQGAGFLDFAEEDGVLLGSRPGGIEAEVYFEASEEGPPSTLVDVEVFDSENSKMASLRSKIVRLAHANPALRADLLSLLTGESATGESATRKPAKKSASRLDGVRGHKLMPASMRSKIPALYSQENEDDPIVYLRFFSPYSGANWLVTEFDGKDTMFGWADLGFGGGELGYISLSELENLQKKGLPLVERDLYFKPQPLRRGLATSRRMAGDKAAVFGPMPRSSYIPKDEPTLARVPGLPEGLEIYTYEKTDARGQVVPYGVAFAGKAQKPLWQYRFRDGNQRDRQISETAKSVEARLKAKQERSEERKQFTHGLQVGDILYSSWGYDQTNVNWFEVVGVPTEKMILVREIASKTLRSDGYGSDQVVPVPGKYVGPVMKKIPKGRAGQLSVKIDSVQTAWKWDGNPKRETSGGWGH